MQGRESLALDRYFRRVRPSVLCVHSCALSLVHYRFIVILPPSVNTMSQARTVIGLRSFVIKALLYFHFQLPMFHLDRTAALGGFSSTHFGRLSSRAFYKCSCALLPCTAGGLQLLLGSFPGIVESIDFNSLIDPTISF